MNQEPEFDQFIDFIAHLSAELASGTSPEYALVRTSSYFGKTTPKPIVGIIDDIVNGAKSFHVAWKDLVNTYNQNRNSRVLDLLGRFIEKGSAIGGERMLQVIKQIRTNNTMTKNRRNLISGQRVKVVALSIVSSIVIGMIAALAPLLTLAFYQGIWTESLTTFSLSLSIQILIAALLTVIVTGYRLTQTVTGSPRTIIFSIIAFGSTYILANHLLLTLL